MNKTDHGNVWSRVHEDKSITVGFNQSFINETLQECFHVMQAENSVVRERGPLMVLETNDGLESIKSPFAGRITYFNPKARNFPDKITEEDTILTLLPPGVEPTKKKATKKSAADVFAQQLWTTVVPVTFGSTLGTTATLDTGTFNQSVRQAQASLEAENREREEIQARLDRTRRSLRRNEIQALTVQQPNESVGDWARRVRDAWEREGV